VEKSSGEKNVRAEIAVVAGPREWGDTRESWLARVPRKVSTVKFRTVKALWYGEIDDPDHWAARDIRRAAAAIQAGRQEAAALASQYETILGGLNARDPDFYSPEIAALLGALRQLRDVDGS
jgi:hypothetical protein